jgi:hypothetical protein
MTALVLTLFIIKEQFPFSNFPMYSNFDNEAEVLFISDQTDRPVAMDKVFRTGSAATKKTYKGELGRLCTPQKRDTKDATAEERAAAGKTVLIGMVKRIKPNSLPPGTTALRLYLRTFALNDGVLSEVPAELLAEQSL